MFPGINPRQMQAAMKKMGVKQTEIPAEEVIIKTKDKNLIIKNPSIIKVNMMGQESLQITGEIEEQEAEKFTEDDVKTVAEQAEVSKEKARESLEKTSGDLAEAILRLKKD